MALYQQQQTYTVTEGYHTTSSVNMVTLVPLVTQVTFVTLLTGPEAEREVLLPDDSERE